MLWFMDRNNVQRADYRDSVSNLYYFLRRPSDVHTAVENIRAVRISTVMYVVFICLLHLRDRPLRLFFAVSSFTDSFSGAR